MSTTENVYHDAVKNVLRNMNFTKGVLAINAASAPTVKTTNALTYSVNGVLYTKTALAAQSIAVTHRYDGSAVSTANPAYTQPISSSVVYLVCLNAAGTVAVVQGTYAGQTVTDANNLSKIVTGTGAAPVEPDGYTCIGTITVETNASATFIPGTTALDAAGVTATYADVSVL